MFVDDDNIINYIENDDKSNNKIKSEKSIIIIKDSERGTGNLVYRGERGRHNVISNKDKSKSVVN